jgi:chaperone modulatory protein CbpM
MSDDDVVRPESREAIERVEAEPIPRGSLRAEEICVHLGISQEVLELCLRWEVIEPPETAEEGVLLFADSAVERIRRGIRLHHDLGINWPGVAVVLDLLERVEALERQAQSRLESE